MRRTLDHERERQPEVLQCAVCGAKPARKVTIRRHGGVILFMLFYRIDKPLCRECGLALTRRWTARTLLEGWWGLFSFFWNWFVLIANWVTAAQLKRLAPPSHEHLPTPEDELRRLNAERIAGAVPEQSFESAKRELLGSL